MGARAIFWLVLVLAGAVAALTPHSAIAPGNGAPGHADFAADCLTCHAPFHGTPVARCLACHVADSIGTRRGVQPAGWTPRPGVAGLHRAVAGIDCGACHVEHAGTAGRVRSFDHARLPAAALPECAACHAADLPTDRRHEGLTAGCGDCHGTDGWRPAQIDHARLAPGRACASCHADARPADVLHKGAGDCAACHRTRAWVPATFDHARWFVLDRHHGPRCATCHDQPGNYRAYTCYGCHAHTPGNVLAEHREEGIRNLEDCARCHRSGSEHEGGGGGHED